MNIRRDAYLWLVLVASFSFAEEGVLDLPDLEVRAPAAQTLWSPPAPTDPASAPGLVVSAQGGRSGQQDLSIRGSSFSGAGLAVGGLALTQPQTEHFNAEWPLPAVFFYPPRVVSGLDQARASDGHLVGSLELRFAPVLPGGTLQLWGGSGGREGQHVQVDTEAGAFQDGTLVVGGFVGRESADKTDSADNDLSRNYGGTRLQWRRDQLQVDAVASVASKEFGARGFYGVTDDWDAEEKIDDKLFLVSAEARDGDEFLRATAYARRFEDEYSLYWSFPGLYHNEHRSDMLSAGVDGYQTGAAGALGWRVAGYDERLTSESLGNHSRSRAVAQVLPELGRGAMVLTLGGAAEVFEDDKPAFLPRAGLDVALSPEQELFVSYVETVRQPSYTELNYESPGSLGQEGLERQKASTLEAGWRGRVNEQIRARLTAFYRWESEAVDWVKPTGSGDRWTAVNLGDVATSGVELFSDWKSGGMWEASLYGQILNQNLDGEEPYASRYVLDIPEEMVRLEGAVLVLKSVRISAAQEYRRASQNPERSSGRDAWLLSLRTEWTPVTLDACTVAVQMDNALDDKFEFLPGQPAIDRTLTASVQWSW